jgi:FixJ family two-component response regulator
MPESHQAVFLLDDEGPVVAALERLLTAQGFRVRSWTSAQAFLDEHDSAVPGCLVTDVCMPGMNGLQLQQELLVRRIHRPIVFLTGEGDIPTAVQAMRGGAVTFLCKPVQRAELVGAVQEALARDQATRAANQEQQTVAQRLAKLTRREHQVLELVASGLLNKQIACELGTAEKTIKVHRGRMMRKMKVATATALVGLLSRAASGGGLVTINPRALGARHASLPHGIVCACHRRP